MFLSGVIISGRLVIISRVGSKIDGLNVQKLFSRPYLEMHSNVLALFPEEIQNKYTYWYELDKVAPVKPGSIYENKKYIKNTERLSALQRKLDVAITASDRKSTATTRDQAVRETAVSNCKTQLNQSISKKEQLEREWNETIAEINKKYTKLIEDQEGRIAICKEQLNQSEIKLENSKIHIKPIGIVTIESEIEIITKEQKRIRDIESAKEQFSAIRKQLHQQLMNDMNTKQKIIMNKLINCIESELFNRCFTVESLREYVLKLNDDEDDIDDIYEMVSDMQTDDCFDSDNFKAIQNKLY
jgi:hypothetical protein